MKIYGYARVSTAKQDLQRQIRNILREAPEAEIITEKYSARTQARPEWRKLFASLQDGDTLILDSVSRMSRSEEEGYKEYLELYERGVTLKFISEPHINTDIYKAALRSAVPMTGGAVDCILEGVNQYLKILAGEQVKLAFRQAQKENEDRSRNTKQGLETAKREGKKLGQKPGAKLTTKKSIAAKEVILKHSKTFGGTLADDEVQKLAGISRNSYYKYKAELVQEARKLEEDK